MITQIFTFESSNKKLDELGVPRINNDGSITLLDIRAEFQNNNLYFNEHGLVTYKDYYGEERNGYLFMYQAGRPEKFGNPAIHLFKCEHINKMIEQNEFHRYKFTESDLVNFISLFTGKSYSNISLDLCGYCREELRHIHTLIEQKYSSEIRNKNLTNFKDIYGYILNWENKSRAYRIKMNYKCEICGIQIWDKNDRKYIHTHHIDKDKSNNEEDNLECLCINCHANKDNHHKQRFRNNRDLIEFNNKYSVDI